MRKDGRECVIVVPEAPAFGGAERLVIVLGSWLAEHSIPHRVLLYRDDIGLGKYAGYPLQTTELRPRSGVLQKIAALKGYLAGQPPGAPAPLMSGIQAALHASLAGVRGFHTLMHDTPSLLDEGGHGAGPVDWLRRRVSDRVLRHGLQSGGKTIVASDYLARECRERYRSAVVVSRPGGSGARQTCRPRIATTELNMLSVSRVEENKRIDWILRALAVLERYDPPLSDTIDWHLDVVGSGALVERMRAKSRDLGLDDRVTFHGFVSEEELARAYERAHLFLMPARQGYGLPAVEALSRGIPVLVHRESGVSDILLDTPWCVVLEGGEPDMAPALEASIRRLIAGSHLTAPLPPIPTQTGWAEEVARLCGWVA